MIRGVGRGFISGWAGVIMIGFALSAVTLCCCCWCYGLLDKRRRRASLDDPVSDLTLQHDSPRFLKLLAHKENERRLSQVQSLPPPGTTPPIKCQSNIVVYSGAVSPYPYLTSSTTNGSPVEDRNIIVPKATLLCPMPMPTDPVPMPMPMKGLSCN